MERNSIIEGEYYQDYYGSSQRRVISIDNDSNTLTYQAPNGTTKVIKIGSFMSWAFSVVPEVKRVKFVDPFATSSVAGTTISTITKLPTVTRLRDINVGYIALCGTKKYLVSKLRTDREGDKVLVDLDTLECILMDHDSDLGTEPAVKGTAVISIKVDNS